MSIFFFLSQTSRSRSQGKKLWYIWKGLVTRNTHVKNQSPSTHCSKVISKVYVKVFKKKGLTTRPMSKGQKSWYPRKALVTRITYVKYQSYSNINIISKVKVFKKWAKLQG